MNTGIEIVLIGFLEGKKIKIHLEYRGCITYCVIIIFKRKNIVRLLSTCSKNKQFIRGSRLKRYTTVDCGCAGAKSSGILRAADFISGSLIVVTACSRRYRLCADRVHAFSRPRSVYGVLCSVPKTEMWSTRAGKVNEIFPFTNRRTRHASSCARELNESKISRYSTDSAHVLPTIGATRPSTLSDNNPR